jgi:succinate-acetate transporter protein
MKEYLMSDLKSAPVLGNPAVVGLGGFGLTTIILQLHNLGLCGIGPVIACGLVFGGLAQFVAGFGEQKVGNNFGYAAFTAYGAFWIALCIILLFNKFDIYTSSKTDIGYFLVVWTLYTTILWFAALRIHGAMASTFTLLVIGFILLDLAHFGYPAMTKVAAYVLILCALNAWYMMAHVIFMGIFGRDVLPVGQPWIDPRPAHPSLGN